MWVDKCSNMTQGVGGAGEDSEFTQTLPFHIDKIVSYFRDSLAKNSMPDGSRA